MPVPEKDYSTCRSAAACADPHGISCQSGATGGKFAGDHMDKTVFRRPHLRDRHRKFSLHGMLDAEPEQSLFHRQLQRQQNAFLRPQMKRPVRFRGRGAFPARHSGL
jgi:hypothetical protein